MLIITRRRGNQVKIGIMLKGIGMFESSWLWVLNPIWIGAFVATIIFAVLWICGAYGLTIYDKI